MTSFAQTYRQLISLSTDASPDMFNSTDDYNKLETLGPSLPKLPYPFPTSQTSAQTANTDITLKSIKPPFRFSTQLAQVPLDQTIYKIKTQLVENVASLKEAGVAAANLKFMIKSKVLSDSTLLSAVATSGDELAITVMVSPPVVAEAAPVATKELDPSVSVPLSISDDAWSKIHAVLAAELSATDAVEVLKKFKSAI